MQTNFLTRWLTACHSPISELTSPDVVYRDVNPCHPWLSFLFLVVFSLTLSAVLPHSAPAADAPAEILLPEIILNTSTNGDASALYVHLPAPAARNGAAVIVCPGGGYTALTMDSEGHDTAAWFARQGVAGLVLKYRLPGKPGNGPTAPLDDAHAALRLVRRRAAEWGLDPRRVGILGYSAGGHLASTAAVHYDADTRPDFALLIYPAISLGPDASAGFRRNLLGANPDPALVDFYSSELHVTRDTPPVFLAHAGDDKSVSALNSVNFYAAMLKAGAPAELHLYERGGHGLRGGNSWGIGPPSPFVSSTWPDRALDWLKQRGLLQPAAPAPPR